MGKKETRGLVVLTLGFCTAFSGVYFWRCVRELTEPSAIELAQIARNVSRGKGFTTDAVYPLSVGLVGRVKHHPELTTPPLPTLLTACAFALRRPSDRVAQAASGILLIPTLVLIWMIGRRVSGPGVAAVACLGYVLSGAVLLSAFFGRADAACQLALHPLAIPRSVPAGVKAEARGTHSVDGEAVVLVGRSVRATRFERLALRLAVGWRGRSRRAL
ncbi:MAG: hypothetical protein GW802_04120, partial [Armatimonadetes bacterium]|nr:hypothetical protein [Armatimonadota bacterium]